MNHRRCIVATLFSAASLALLASRASADIITFEEIGVQAINFEQTTALTGQYTERGVTFSGAIFRDGGGVLDQDSNFGVNARSGRQFLAFNRVPQAVYADGGHPLDPENIVFTALQASVEIYGSGGENSSTFRLEAYDASGQLLGTDTRTSPAFGWQRISFASDIGIQRIILRETTNNTSFLFDDLSFTALTPPCEADFNHDDVVDFFDYLDFVAAFAAASASADFNHDDVVDFFDYLDFVQEFSIGC